VSRLSRLLELAVLVTEMQETEFAVDTSWQAALELVTLDTHPASDGEGRSQLTGTKCHVTWLQPGEY
jgi:hypothetical protein